MGVGILLLLLVVVVVVQAGLERGQGFLLLLEQPTQLRWVLVETVVLLQE